MESMTPVSPQHENEISLKDLILKTQEWGKYLRKKWLIILTVSLLMAGLGLAYAIMKKPKYIAKLTFVLEDSKSNPLGAYAGLASQFAGIDLGGASNSGVFSGDNILEFLKSRLIVEKTLLSFINHRDTLKTLADFYIEMNDLRKSWRKEPLLKNLHFPVNSDRKEFSRQQDSILGVMYKRIIKENLGIAKIDKKLSFISVTCTTKDEIFSKAFTERLVNEATDFYIQTRTQRSKTTVDKLQQKADSIESLLNSKTYSVAASQDLNLNPARSMAGVSTELVSRDKMVLQTIFAEVTKNLEVSRMSMAQETPVIQAIDTPILPLAKEEFGVFKGLILGGFIGFFLTSFFLIFIRLYKSVME